MRRWWRRIQEARHRKRVRATAIRALGGDEVAAMTVDRLLVLCEGEADLKSEVMRLKIDRDRADKDQRVKDYLFGGGR